ncbi:Photosystem II reaction center Psb28 protein [Quillaja saponaria]|uniref:Photosystem II reaction center Psb28 protein n=1 Tax=Quillaja saponaria TaxID=32244 RepID=A0AAD7Q0I4_QUISA|nr:Photosystem II reaction center Psb28 protein [Quillaja saponaria]
MATLHSLAFSSPVSNSLHWPRSFSEIISLPVIQGKHSSFIGQSLHFPCLRLTKSRDGTNGVAIFSFVQPSVFDSSAEVGEITGFYMIDEEGVLQSVDVSAKFVNGKPSRIEARYVMRTPRYWDRFMRFME